VLAFAFLNAYHGDACLVTWPSQGQRRTMLIDGGPARTYRSAIISQLSVTATSRIDVACVTHIDDDHAAGVIRLLTDISRARADREVERVSVDRLWFNDVIDLVDSAMQSLTSSPEVINDIELDAVLAASYRQGRDLRRLSSQLGLTGNQPFNGLIRQGATAAVHDLHVTAITPDHGALKALAVEWQRALRHDDSAAMTAALADHSVTNLSSITLHLQRGPHSALLTGDARADHILAGLTASGLLNDHPLLLDVLKLPHHGSAKSVTPAFFTRLHARHYVISTDGTHGHPNRQTLQWLVTSRATDDDYTIHLTNPVDSAQQALRELQRGRRFTINTRVPSAASIVVQLEDQN
jgi:beta-lactamase superfamily II metal-dependent hydrolase